jgi:uncharacterized protein (UPF0332 family)
MSDPYGDIFFAKAEESLAGAVSEYVNGRHNNCANRAYYAACFQAAVAALVCEGVGRSEQADQGLRLRKSADYTIERVSDVQASRALSRARAFVAAIRTEEGRSK